MVSPPSLFLYEERVVEIFSVSPNVGLVAGGLPVVLTGRGFLGIATGTSTVEFDGIPATSIVVESDSRITLEVPAHAVGSVDIVVTNSDGGTYTLDDGFIYETTPPPSRVVYRTPSGAMAQNVRLENPPPTISQVLGQPWQASFTSNLEPGGRMAINWWVFGEPLFEGTVTGKSGRSEGAKKDTVWDINCTGHAHLLGRRYPTGEWENVSATTVLLELMSGWGHGFSSAGVEVGLSEVTVQLDGSTDLWSAIVQVCGLCGAKAFIAGTQLFCFTEDSGYDPPADITDDNPDLCYPEQGQAVVIDYDFTTVRNRVTVYGAEGISVTVEDSASISQFDVIEFPIFDNRLTTLAELQQRGQEELDAYAQPIPTVRYACRDLKTMAGKTVSINVTAPPINGDFIIQTVKIDQLELAEVGTKPRFSVTACPSNVPMSRASGTDGVLQKALDVAENKDKQPRLDGDVQASPGGRVTIPAGSIAASKLAGCIDSDLLSDTTVVPDTYGEDGAHLVSFTVDRAGRLTAAAVDPVPVLKTDGSQDFTADQSMGGHALTNVSNPIDPQDAATKAYVDNNIDYAIAEALEAAEPTSYDSPLSVLNPVGGSVWNEVPSGSVNGSNAVFTTAQAYANLRVFLNGVRQKKTTHYTETSSTTFTFGDAPATGDLLIVDYNGGSMPEIVFDSFGDVVVVQVPL